MKAQGENLFHTGSFRCFQKSSELLGLQIHHSHLCLCLCSPVFVFFFAPPYSGFPGSSMVKNLPSNAGEECSIPGSGRSPGVENGNPLQCSCLENFMDRGAWQATIHGAAESQIQLSDRSQHTGMEPVSSAVETWSPNPWAPRELPLISFS